MARFAFTAIIMGVALMGAAPPTPAPWAGTHPGQAGALATYRYRGQGDGGTLLVNVTTVGMGQVEVHAEVSGHFCAGSFDGSGPVQVNRVVASGDQVAPQCRMTLVQTGRRMSVQVSPECAMLSGASCGFMGSVTQIQ